MGKVKSEKKRVSKASSSSKLDLLRKKLELEQDMLNKGDNPSSSEKIEEIDEQIEQVDEQEAQPEQPQEEHQEPDPSLEKEEISKVADLIKDTQQEHIVEEQHAEILDNKSFSKRIQSYQKLFLTVRKEVQRILVGQDEAITGLIRALISDGHVLLEGVPGIAKTTLIRTLAQTTGCSFARIQFTPDLLPTDIIGISTYQEGRGFYTLKGPIFNNFILADEINRAPPKVQSALLESMAEKQATIAKESFPIPLPFFTMATQNPLENVGTYSLPEAQVDRFLFKIYMGYPNIDEEQRILRSNISTHSFENFKVKAVLSPDLILKIQDDVKKVYVDQKVEHYIVKLIDATRFPKKYGVGLGRYVEFGASPRGSIGLISAARAEAVLNGQNYVTPHHVKTIAYDVLRHRLILSYEGQAEGIKAERVIEEILRKVPVP